MSQELHDLRNLRMDFVKRVKDVTKMRVLIKGLESGDDARLAVSSGADGIIVSNHGGRAAEARGRSVCPPGCPRHIPQRIGPPHLTSR